MDSFGTFEIRVIGSKGNVPLSPDNFDIREIMAIFGFVEDILFPNASRMERPVISYSLEEGSVKNVFKTSLQTIVATTAVLSLVHSSQSLDGLELKSALAIESLQEEALRKDCEIELSTSQSGGPALVISPQTNYRRSSELWADAELYFYGTLNDAGGKERSNIHLDTKEYGQIKIDADRTFLKNLSINPLYKEFGVRARGKQNIRTGEIDKSRLVLLSIHPYHPVYDEEYINNLIAKASEDWKGVDVDDFMTEVRGYEQ